MVLDYVFNDVGVAVAASCWYYDADVAADCADGVAVAAIGAGCWCGGCLLVAGTAVATIGAAIATSCRCSFCCYWYYGCCYWCCGCCHRVCIMFITMLVLLF